MLFLWLRSHSWSAFHKWAGLGSVFFTEGSAHLPGQEAVCADESSSHGPGAVASPHYHRVLWASSPLAPRQGWHPGSYAKGAWWGWWGWGDSPRVQRAGPSLAGWGFWATVVLGLSWGQGTRFDGQIWAFWAYHCSYIFITGSKETGPLTRWGTVRGRSGPLLRWGDMVRGWLGCRSWVTRRVGVLGAPVREKMPWVLGKVWSSASPNTRGLWHILSGCMGWCVDGSSGGGSVWCRIEACGRGPSGGQTDIVLPLLLTQSFVTVLVTNGKLLMFNV